MSRMRKQKNKAKKGITSNKKERPVVYDLNGMSNAQLEQVLKLLEKSAKK